MYYCNQDICFLDNCHNEGYNLKKLAPLTNLGNSYKDKYSFLDKCHYDNCNSVTASSINVPQKFGPEPEW